MTPRTRTIRRLAGLLMLLLAMAPSAAAFAAPGAASCSMCASHCCCRPAGGAGGGCRLSAPCAGREPALGLATPVVRVILTSSAGLSRPEPAVTGHAVSPAARPLSRTAVPPVPPPRPIAA